MRRLLFTSSLVFSLALLVISCQKGSSGGGGNPNPTPNQSLTVTLSKNQVKADGFDEVVISVKDQANNDVTSSSTIFVNNGAVADNKFSTSSPGTYGIKATRNSLTSAVVNLTAQDPGPSPFTQKVLVEDFTGTWCGYCPRVGIALTNYINTHPKCIVVGIHGPAGSSDPYNYQYVTALASSVNLTGWPTVIVNRDFKWNENPAFLDQEANKRAPLGIGFETSITGSTINVKAKVKFDVTTQMPMKIIVMLVEDGLVHPQVNYYPNYGSNPIPGYVHNHTLRKAATDIFGELIPAASQVSGNTWEKNYTFNAASYNINNCKIVATVIYDNISGRKGSLNSQIVAAGQNKVFD